MKSAIQTMPYALVPRCIALVVLLFLAVYIPAFAIAGGLRLPLDRAVPAVILLTFAIACLLIVFLARRGGLGATAFGVASPRSRYALAAMALAVPLSALAAWSLAHVAEPGPLAGLTLAPWQVYLYFIVAAPIQEETIFRGLLQSVLARRLQAFAVQAATAGIAASLAIAVLFALIHLTVGPLTALFALVLGVLAGELRRRSGSLLPGVVCHAIFNLGGILWVLA